MCLDGESQLAWRSGVRRHLQVTNCFTLTFYSARKLSNQADEEGVVFSNHGFSRLQMGHLLYSPQSLRGRFISSYLTEEPAAADSLLSAAGAVVCYASHRRVGDWL